MSGHGSALQLPKEKPRRVAAAFRALLTDYRCGVVLVSGVEVVVLLLFGVELEFGFEVLFGLDEFMSVELLELLLGFVEFMSVLELLLELGVVALLPVEAEPLAPVVEFTSEPVVLEGEVVEDGELDVPLCVEELDGELWL